jgi:hypothetical protein
LVVFFEHLGGPNRNNSFVDGLAGQPFNEIFMARNLLLKDLQRLWLCLSQPASKFINNVMKHFTETGGMLEDEYLRFFQGYVPELQQRQIETGANKTADEVAEVIMNVIVAEDPTIRTRSSKFSEAFMELKAGMDPDWNKQQVNVIDLLLSYAA